MTNKFGISIDELIEQLQATEPMEVTDPVDKGHYETEQIPLTKEERKEIKGTISLDDPRYFEKVWIPDLYWEQRTLRPEEVRERAKEYLTMIASGPNASYSIKERKRLAKIIGYKGKIKVDEYVRGMMMRENLKLAGGIVLWAAIIAGFAGGCYYMHHKIESDLQYIEKTYQKQEKR
jgi:hypothetical protein